MFIPFRDENPSLTTPYVTRTLIAVNVIAFLLELTFGEREAVVELGAIPWEIAHFQNLRGSEAVPPYITLITSMFLHGGWLHLLSNMLYLWIFGDNIEDRMGHGRFLLFYLLAGVVAALSHIGFNTRSVSTFVPMVGASGAIAGVLGAYLRLFPRARVRTLIWWFIFVRVIALPASFVLGFWIFLQVFYGLNSVSAGVAGGVAWLAHIGGFAVGMLLVRWFERKDQVEIV
ncbi:MAG: rhomboid family intramembrane serine protease [Candidatus Bipolaricaulia bacterium]